MPLSIRRRYARRDGLVAVRNSCRFSGAASELGKRVSRPNFEGYWACRGSIHGTQCLPSQSNVTLLWIHGGAYISGSALAALVPLLRIAELAAEQNLSINIFTLEYSLAPEAKFPTQLTEVTAAYKYLVEEEKIDPDSIFLLGESAGGHLALSLAYNLLQQGLPRPGKVGLLYPWVNLENSGTSFEMNKYKDCLDKGDLDQCAEGLVGGDGRSKFADFMNFASSPPRQALRWSQVLPSTWVIIGGNDVFVSDVCKFVDEARKDGVPLDFHMEPRMPHGWLGWYDALAEKRYLQLSPADDASCVMPGSELIAEVLCAHGQGRAPATARSSCRHSPVRLSTCLSCLRDSALDAAGNGLPGKTSSWGGTPQTCASSAGAQSERPSPALSLPPPVGRLR
jgi:acetyl esterase/lipase